MKMHEDLYQDRRHGAALRLEPLEPRLLLSAANIGVIASHEYADGVIVTLFDINTLNGTSAPNIAWTKAERVKGTTDVFVNPGSIGDAEVKAIKLYGDGTRTADLGVLVENNTGLKKFVDLRTGTTDLGFLATYGYLGRLDTDAGIVGVDINGLDVPSGASLHNDMDHDGVLDDPTSLWALAGAGRVDIGDDVGGDLTFGDDVATLWGRGALNAEARVEGELGKLRIVGDWVGDLFAEWVGSARTWGELTAAITITGQDADNVSMRKLRVDHANGATVDAPGGVQTVKTGDWLGGSITAGWLDSLRSTGEFSADVTLSGAGAPNGVLGSAKIDGEATGGTWWVDGDGSKFRSGGTAAAWAANFTGGLNKLTIKGNAGGTAAAQAFGTVKVTGDATNAQFLAGADLGTDAVLGGAGAAADTFGPGTFGKLNVGGQVTNTVFAAGLDPVDGVINNGDDVLLGGAASSFDSIKVVGNAGAQSRFLGGAFPRRARINHYSTDPNIDLRFRLGDIPALDITPDGGLPATLLLHVGYNYTIPVAIGAGGNPIYMFAAEPGAGDLPPGMQVRNYTNDPLRPADTAYLVGKPKRGSETPGEENFGVRVTDLCGTTDDLAAPLAYRVVGPAGITVTPRSGLQTTEAGGAATFDVVLDSEPSDDVTIALESTRVDEGTLSTDTLTFTPLDWDDPQTVTITGVDDAEADGNIKYKITTAPAVSGDPAYDGLNAPNVKVTNVDDEAAPEPGPWQVLVRIRGAGEVYDTAGKIDTRDNDFIGTYGSGQIVDLQTDGAELADWYIDGDFYWNDWQFTLIEDDFEDGAIVTVDFD